MVAFASDRRLNPLPLLFDSSLFDFSLVDMEPWFIGNRPMEAKSPPSHLQLPPLPAEGGRLAGWRSGGEPQEDSENRDR